VGAVDVTVMALAALATVKFVDVPVTGVFETAAFRVNRPAESGTRFVNVATPDVFVVSTTLLVGSSTPPPFMEIVTASLTTGLPEASFTSTAALVTSPTVVLEGSRVNVADAATPTMDVLFGVPQFQLTIVIPCPQKTEHGP